MRKLLNVISYALNVVFIVFIAVMLTKQNEGAVESQPEEPQEEVQPEESDAERVKRMVVERERADIPLHEQEYEGVIKAFEFANEAHKGASLSVESIDFNEEL